MLLGSQKSSTHCYLQSRSSSRKSIQFLTHPVSIPTPNQTNQIHPSQILCAALNRIYSFVSPYGSTIYLNWYAGETSTAVIVANLPHLWPLISRVFHVGTFKPSSGGEAFYPPGFVACAGAAASRGRDIDKHGYVRHESEGRIADGRMQWQDRKSFSSAEDMELRKYLTPETGMET